MTFSSPIFGSMEMPLLHPLGLAAAVARGPKLLGDPEPAPGGRHMKSMKQRRTSPSESLRKS